MRLKLEDLEYTSSDTNCWIESTICKHKCGIELRIHWTQDV